MPLTEQCIADLNQIMNHIRMVGVNMMSARRAFEKTKDYGIAAMLKNETMERWGIAGKIAKYLTENDAIVTYSATPASTIQSANTQALQTILPMDGQTVEVLDAKISEAMVRGSYRTSIFMDKIRNCYQKEYAEIKDIINEIVRVSADPGAMVMYDKWLCEEYADRYHGYDPC